VKAKEETITISQDLITLNLTPCSGLDAEDRDEWRWRNAHVVFSL